MLEGSLLDKNHHKLRMCEKLAMKLSFAQLIFPVFFILSILPLVCADLNSDKIALLAFAANVTHGPKLKWSNVNGDATNICTSWMGITCSSDGTRVLMVRLPAIGLSGPIPSNTLGQLDALRVLSLRSNHLTGSIPSDILSHPSLRSLFLQENNFTSNIPASFPTRLHILDLSFNSFTGKFPTKIQDLTRLTSLYLQYNSLSGAIPNVTISNLKHINISFNHFIGSIPLAFQSFPNSSFIGNPFLCGVPLKFCVSKKKFPLWGIIGIAVVGSIAVLLLAVVFVFCCLTRRESSDSSRVQKRKSSTGKQSEKSVKEFGSPDDKKLVVFEGSYNIDHEDLLQASAEILGKGSFGTAYKAVLEDSTPVVVKRLKDVTASKKEFEQQMELIGRVSQHQNVVSLRAYCYSKDEKLLVYDYFAGGSLMTLLHGKIGGLRITFNWETRVKIALGIARGIAHIHSTGGPRFTHGNIKASNILIDQDMEARVTDFGLTPITNILPVPPSSNSSGYQAPEVLETRLHSHKSDVYSFGVLLLEILTAKQPFQSPSRDKMVDLPKWVQSLVREEWAAEVFDTELMIYQNIEEEMMQMLRIGLACVDRVAIKRPTIDELVGMIEQIRVYEEEIQPPSD